MLYQVVCYTNRREDVSFKIYKIFSSKEKAILYAKKLAMDEYGEDDVSDYILDEEVYLDNVIVESVDTWLQSLDSYISHEYE